VSPLIPKTSVNCALAATKGRRRLPTFYWSVLPTLPPGVCCLLVLLQMLNSSQRMDQLLPK
jgi:hypothetical protein